MLQAKAACRAETILFVPQILILLAECCLDVAADIGLKGCKHDCGAFVRARTVDQLVDIACCGCRCSCLGLTSKTHHREIIERHICAQCKCTDSPAGDFDKKAEHVAIQLDTKGMCSSWSICGSGWTAQDGLRGEADPVKVHEKAIEERAGFSSSNFSPRYAARNSAPKPATNQGSIFCSPPSLLCLLKDSAKFHSWRPV